MHLPPHPSHTQVPYVQKSADMEGDEAAVKGAAVQMLSTREPAAEVEREVRPRQHRQLGWGGARACQPPAGSARLMGVGGAGGRRTAVNIARAASTRGDAAVKMGCG